MFSQNFLIHPELVLTTPQGPNACFGFKFHPFKYVCFAAGFFFGRSILCCCQKVSKSFFNFTSFELVALPAVQRKLVQWSLLFWCKQKRLKLCGGPKKVCLLKNHPWCGFHKVKFTSAINCQLSLTHCNHSPQTGAMNSSPYPRLF